jgi:hypothetical protein
MLSHLRSVLEGGYIIIHPKFEKLLCITPMHRQGGKVNETAMSHSHVFDSLRMAAEIPHHFGLVLFQVGIILGFNLLTKLKNYLCIYCCLK